MPAPTPSPDSSPSRATAVAVVGTDLVLAAFPATPVQIAHALERLGFDVVVPASWGDELLAAAALARLDERGGVPAVYCACPRVAERLLATGQELAPMLLSLVAPPVAVARYVRAAYAGRDVTVTYLGGCGAAADPSIDARMTPREFLRALHDHDLALAEMPRVFEGVIPPDRRRHLSLPGGLPDAARLAGLAMPRRLACLTSADYAAELAQLVIAREPVLIDVAARLGCACAGAMPTTPFERAHETVMHLEPPRAAHPVVDVSIAGRMDAPLPPPRAPEPPRPEIVEPAPGHSPRTSTPPRPLPAFGGPVPPRSVQHTPPSHTQRFTSGEPTTGPLRRRGGVSGFFRAVGSAEQPRARTGEGLALPRAYVARRRPASDGVRTSGEQRAADAREEQRVAEERERPITRHVEPVATPTPPPMAAFVAPATVDRTTVDRTTVDRTTVDRTTVDRTPDAPVEAPRRVTAAVARTPATPVDDMAVAPVAAAPTATLPTTPATAREDAAREDAARLVAAFAMPESPAATATAELPVPAAIATGADADTEPAFSAWPSPTSHVTPRVVPPPPTPASGSGRELLFFVVGAVLAGLAFALFR